MILDHPDRFLRRHIGPDAADLPEMLRTVGVSSLDALIDEVVPAAIRADRPLNLPHGLAEAEYLALMREVAAANTPRRSFIGLGYYDCFTPPVILRNVMENPGWYTPYTPYQAEIAQGRLESLLNFQTMVRDLTGMEVANASLLDEPTAAAEAMTLLHRVQPRRPLPRQTFLVSSRVWPQTRAVLHSRAEPLGIDVREVDPATVTFDDDVFGMLIQYPDGVGAVADRSALIERAHEAGVLVAVATDLLALTLLLPPGEMGADVVVGNAQRFGVPLGYGGPHAAFFATREAFVRQMPGRVIGVSVDGSGRTAYRMALQTREQHIRREKATSNICTAQALLANMAAMYAVYHGPAGLRAIATRVHQQAVRLATALHGLGFEQRNSAFFDTLQVRAGKAAAAVRREAERAGINLRYDADEVVIVAFDETVSDADVQAVSDVFARAAGVASVPIPDPAAPAFGPLARRSAFLEHPVFNAHHSETEMMRYIRNLERKDIGLDTSMIALGSCTMKLNAAAEMMPVTWPAFASLHPFAPREQAQGYTRIIGELEAALCEVTGFAAVSLQPNSGAQGELAGLLVIRAWHHSRGEGHRNVVLIPSSAHGTNPASAVMAGMRVVVVATDARGYVDLEDLKKKAAEHDADLAALMVTYPSTHGVYEETIRDVCRTVHEHGGQVYMDGANMNAQVGLTSPAAIGADVCHLNLHKTFAIPHGGGGPGMGPIGVAAHLAPFLPGHPLVPTGGEQAIDAVAGAPWGSASILLISYGYIRMLGGEGLTAATRYAILNANYLKSRLERHYDVLYTNAGGRVAHEMIFDLRGYKAAGVDEIDVAKRLMDYGFHAPTVSFPVPGTLMIEPTESEPLAELDRFCEAMISIRAEIEAIVTGQVDPRDNVLKNAPHTAAMVADDGWSHPYSRREAAFPLPWVRANKVWPAVARIDNPYGDRNLMCVCPPLESYVEAEP
jgi:glycine cleavage system P protein (glycine dehydrogenase)